ncbi:vitamin B12 transporter [Paucibacter oligotrophus]|uniref:Vitamin B12 transporter n=1 Tax=Roseateles oligotrophus TaxID=1769250 RepID=A0A840LIG9_9BURK|nr:TonB-dependent receptor [Roseateles oligotrophus]MBB4845779.1 vitamin B12 transporter [Roseateles oligotrophus]
MNPNALRPPVLAALSLLAALSAQAQNNAPARLDAVTVTATRSASPLKAALADVTVLERADIERLGYGGLPDLLRTQAGFEITRNGNPGSTTSVFLRGASSQHTVLLIDGVRMDKQSGSGGASWENLPLAQIERIEVLRGAASALYGSDAVAGVVQVFTRKAQPGMQLDVGAGLGSLGRFKADTSLRGSAAGFDYSLGLATEVAEGFNARPLSAPVPGYEPDRDGWRSQSANARLGWQPTASQRLEVQALSSRTDSQYDASARPKPGVDDRNLNENKLLRALWRADWTADWQTEISASQSRDRYETRPSAYLTETQLRSLSLQSNLKVGPGKLVAILERREDELLNSGLRASSAGQAQRQQDGLALGYLLSLGALDAQLNLRHDRDSKFGGIDTGTVAAGYRFSPQWRVWASAGNAFRAPTLYQSFSEYGPKDGGKALDPERSRNLETGLSFNSGAHELGLSVYRNEVRDLIDWSGAFLGNCPPQAVPQPWDGCYGNLSSVRLSGASLKGATELLGLKLSGSLDFQDSKDLSTGKQLDRRAKRIGRLRADKSLGAWSLGAQALASSERSDRYGPKPVLPGYAVLDLDVGYALSKSTRLQVNLDNALNREYQTAGGYAQAPRSIFFSLRYNTGN